VISLLAVLRIKIIRTRSWPNRVNYSVVILCGATHRTWRPAFAFFFDDTVSRVIEARVTAFRLPIPRYRYRSCRFPLSYINCTHLSAATADRGKGRRSVLVIFKIRSIQSGMLYTSNSYLSLYLIHSIILGLRQKFLGLLDTSRY